MAAGGPLAGSPSAFTSSRRPLPPPSISSLAAAAIRKSNFKQRLDVSAFVPAFRIRLHSHARRLCRSLLQVHAGAVDASSDGSRWWQKGSPPNMRDTNSTQEFLDALANAGEKLVVVEFFATWCGSCKALYPKLCQIAAEHPDIDFLKVNFDENKPMCKSLNVKVLPFFHFYRGADGRLDSFSCSLSKVGKLKEAIATHNTDRCSIGPPLGLGEDIQLLGAKTQLTAGSAV